uniref:G-protein coupled receptors family 1 profile domain-containing protein n=1 Tax=Microcebus murinus TaxID=30608 RepID=A0A8C5XMM5_MICMU
MERWNHTSSDFILLGLFPPNQTGLLFFSLIILVFFLLAMIHLIRVDPLSLMDLMCISTTIPKMAFNFLSGQKGISFLGCGVQSFFFVTTIGSEGLLLASMAYDQYVAICHPLHYPDRMSNRMCVKMIIGSWTVGSRAIDHFFCDVPAMLSLACMDTWVHEYMVFVSTTLFLLLPFLGITASYGRVLLVIYHMCSKEGRKKAFATCSTHLTVVTFNYTPFVYTYLWPKNLRSPAEDKILAVFYTMLTPMLTAIIYSLRNKEVLEAMTRVFGIFCILKE